MSVRWGLLLLRSLLLEGWRVLGLVLIDVVWLVEAENESYSIVVVQDLEVLIKDDDSLLKVIDHLFPASNFIEFLRYSVDILLCDLVSDCDEF